LQRRPQVRDIDAIAADLCSDRPKFAVVGGQSFRRPGANWGTATFIASGGCSWKFEAVEPSLAIFAIAAVSVLLAEVMAVVVPEPR
jgi:hypothetical protein